jgi:hypothetical protein
MISEKMPLDLLVLSEFKPIGGDGDKVMERKEEARWAPVLATSMAANETLVERATENGLLGFKLDLGDNAILRCHPSLEDPYMFM